MKVYLIGAGPGDPGLLTIKGKDILEKADVVVYDYLANDTLLGYARPDAERIYVGKVAGNHALPQDGINKLIIEKAKEGKIVARLKGGDPYIFGRGRAVRGSPRHLQHHRGPGLCGHPLDAPQFFLVRNAHHRTRKPR